MISNIKNLIMKTTDNLSSSSILLGFSVANAFGNLCLIFRKSFRHSAFDGRDKRLGNRDLRSAMFEKTECMEAETGIRNSGSVERVDKRPTLLRFYPFNLSKRK